MICHQQQRVMWGVNAAAGQRLCQSMTRQSMLCQRLSQNITVTSKMTSAAVMSYKQNKMNIWHRNRAYRLVYSHKKYHFDVCRSVILAIITETCPIINWTINFANLRQCCRCYCFYSVNQKTRFSHISMSIFCIELPWRIFDVDPLN